MGEFLSGSQWWKFRWWKRNYSIILVVLFALLLRLWAVWQLPMDADEPVYDKMVMIMLNLSKLVMYEKSSIMNTIVNIPLW